MSIHEEFQVRGARVLITGAAIGMGRIYAERALREGAALVHCWDRDAAQLERTVADLGAAHGTDRVEATTVDIADNDAVQAAATALLEAHGAPHVLINNAGIVRGALFWEHDVDRDIQLTMQVNAVGPMVLTRALLPAMLADDAPRRILNIASAAGTLANPRMSVYAASKWAMIGWSDSLRLELDRAAGGTVKVTTFCPSYISTGMFAGARGPLLTPVLSPEVATDRAWRAMLAGKPVRSTPWTVGLARGLKGILPVGAWDVVAGKVFKVYSSMDAFTGRAGAPDPEAAAAGDAR